MKAVVKEISRVLFVNPFGIGDVLFTTPLVAQVRKIMPAARIGFVCNRRVHSILAQNPDLDVIWVLERDEFRSLWGKSKREFFQKCWRLFSQIRDERFDLAFDLSLSNQFGFFLALMGVKRRLGFCYRNRGKFLSERLSFAGYSERPVAQYQLDLLGLLAQTGTGRDHFLKYKSPQEAIAAAARMLKDLGLVSGKRIVGIAPGGGESWGPRARLKQWSPDHYAALCRLLRDSGYELVFLGSWSDRPIVEEIARDVRGTVATLAGTCSLEVSAAAMLHCEFVVTNDGGLLHLAVAQDVPTVSFFGPTDERVYGPFPAGPRHLVLVHPVACRPCYRNFRLPPCPENKRCLEELSAREAFEKIVDWRSGVLAVGGVGSGSRANLQG